MKRPRTLGDEGSLGPLGISIGAALASMCRTELLSTQLGGLPHPFQSAAWCGGGRAALSFSSGLCEILPFSCWSFLSQNTAHFCFCHRLPKQGSQTIAFIISKVWHRVHQHKTHSVNADSWVLSQTYRDSVGGSLRICILFLPLITILKILIFYLFKNF